MEDNPLPKADHELDLLELELSLDKLTSEDDLKPRYDGGVKEAWQNSSQKMHSGVSSIPKEYVMASDQRASKPMNLELGHRYPVRTLPPIYYNTEMHGQFASGARNATDFEAKRTVAMESQRIPSIYQMHDQRQNSNSNFLISNAMFEERIILERHLDALHFQLEELCENHAPEKEKHDQVFQILQYEDRHFRRYQVLTFLELISDNWEPSIQQIVPLTMHALEKFGLNLLKPVQERPPLWRTINCNSAMFQSTLEPINGVYSILALLGYKDFVEGETGKVLSVEFNASSFDRNKVRKLTADFVIAKYELEAIMNAMHPHLDLVTFLISEECQKSVQSYIDGSNSFGNDSFDGSDLGPGPFISKPALVPQQILSPTPTAKPQVEYMPYPTARTYPLPNAVPMNISRPNTTWVLSGNVASPGAFHGLSNPPPEVSLSQFSRALNYHPRSAGHFGGNSMLSTLERPSSFHIRPVSAANAALNASLPPHTGPGSMFASSLSPQRHVSANKEPNFRFEVPSLYEQPTSDIAKLNAYEKVLSSSSQSRTPEATYVKNSPSVTARRENPQSGFDSPKVESQVDNNSTDEWSCDHCTFLNPSSTKVCQMCDKTSGWKKDVQVKVEPLKRIIPQNQFRYAVFYGPIEDQQGHVVPSGVSGQRSTRAAIEQKYPEIIAYENGHPVVTLKSSLSQDLRGYPAVVAPVDQRLHAGMSGGRFFEGAAPSQPCTNPRPPLNVTPKPPQMELKPADLNATSPQSTESQHSLPRQGSAHSSQQVIHNALPPTQEFSMHRTFGNFVNPVSYKGKLKLREDQEAINEAKRRTEEREKRNQDEIELVNNLREAENRGFAVELYEIAALLHPTNPLDFLINIFPDWLEDIMDGFSDNDDALGKLSRSEAEEAYIACQGQVEEAVEWAQSVRKKRIDELSNDGVYEKADILDALYKSEGDVEGAKVYLERKALAPFLQRIWMDERELVPKLYDRLRNEDLDKESRVRLIMAEKKTTWGRGDTAVRLIDETDCVVEDCIEAAVACGFHDKAKRYLDHTCAICLSQMSIRHLTTNLNCQCLLCYPCWSDYFSVTIKEKHIRHLTCPICGVPDMKDEHSIVEYFNNISNMIRHFVKQGSLEPQIYEVFEIKLRDFTLKKDPNFRWCAHCPENGFIWDDPLRTKMICHKCLKSTCFLCQEKWLPQHTGISCELFRQWKEVNDPEYLNQQSANLSSQLAKHGIKCPDCHFTYDLARGGCMHFHCLQCGYEFCSGCSQAFRNGAQCTVHESCQYKGLHAHHPRNCFYYMRDFDTKDIKKLLKDRKVKIDTAQPEGQGNICRVMEQHETESGMKDEACGKEAVNGNAGFCEKHYKEYLVQLVNGNGIDPVALLNLDEVKRLLERSFQAYPIKEKKERDKHYLVRLREFVKEALPLQTLNEQVLKGHSSAERREEEQLQGEAEVQQDEAEAVVVDNPNEVDVNLDNQSNSNEDSDGSNDEARPDTQLA